MGLDSYLTEEIYIGGHFEFRKVSGNVSGDINGKPFEMDLKEVATITKQVGYWRKANAIHAWFVRNVQAGVDDCRRYYVPIEKLIELRDICNNCIEAVKLGDYEWVEENLPTQSGFFFGSTEYDEYYIEGLEYTVEVIDKLVDSKNDIYYESSW